MTAGPLTTRLATVTATATNTATEVWQIARLTRDLPGFLRTPLSEAEAAVRIRQRLETRDTLFLASVERAIYGHARSPYRRLLRHAGCELGDLRALVQHEGIEGALTILAARGVYVSFDELKGRREAIRGSARFRFSPRDFDSPLVRPHYATYTGGSRGVPVLVPRSLPYVEELASSRTVSLAAFGLHGQPHAFWLTNPMTTMLMSLKTGSDALLWVHPLQAFPVKGRIGARYLELMGRASGAPIPRPRFLATEQVSALVRWVARRLREHGPFVIDAVPSSAVRLSVAAQEAGVRLDGLTFCLQSEPLTRARHDHIAAAGARRVVHYTSIEMSGIASSCAASSQADDLHVFTDRYAIIECERPLIVEAAGDVATVQALLLTTLTPTIATVSFNTEPGDHARLEQRPCGCSLGALGLTTHVSEVRSFEKLSAEGVSFVRSNVLQVLEEVLPATFGGSSLDYQLVEEEATASNTSLVLRIHPAVGALDEGRVRETLLRSLAAGGTVDANHAELLRLAGSVTISRQPPVATPAGKVLPLQLARRAGTRSAHHPTMRPWGSRETEGPDGRPPIDPHGSQVPSPASGRAGASSADR